MLDQFNHIMMAIYVLHKSVDAFPKVNKNKLHDAETNDMGKHDMG